MKHINRLIIQEIKAVIYHQKTVSSKCIKEIQTYNTINASLQMSVTYKKMFHFRKDKKNGLK